MGPTMGIIGQFTNIASAFERMGYVSTHRCSVPVPERELCMSSLCFTPNKQHTLAKNQGISTSMICISIQSAILGVYLFSALFFEAK